MSKKKNLALKEQSLKRDKKVNRIFGNILITKSVITFALVFVLFFICYMYKEKITKLTIISIDSFLNVGYIFMTISVLALILGVLMHLKTNIVSPLIGYYIYSIHDLINFIMAVVYLVFFILSFLITPTTVSGNSMNNTLYDNDMLLVWHLNYKSQRDDVVIVDITNDKYPVYQEEQFYIKRIVAIEDDHLHFEAEVSNPLKGNFYVNDELVESSMNYTEFLALCSIYTNFKLVPYTYSMYDAYVPSGYSVVLGDNRNNSNDSRYIGSISNNDILGKAVFRYFSRKGKIGIIKKDIK